MTPRVRPSPRRGTPRLPIGLNLGAQLFWQARAFPAEFARVARILMYPQYWAYRLTGVLANEVTSLGCHTDLWDYRAGDFSTLVDRQGWRPLMAPMRRASELLGRVLPEIAQATGLPATTPVHCGIHDSNASLLPHLVGRAKPFAVVSTGTWVIAMAIGGAAVELDPARDTLVNVNAFGDPVPSARFMGGREFATLVHEGGEEPAARAIEAVLETPILLMPSVQQGSGPFPTRKAEWIGGEPSGDARHVAASFYLAMMTATALELIGADGPTIVEGPFALNGLFVGMLAAATARPVIPAGGSATGTSIGAALAGGRRGRVLAAPPIPTARRSCRRGARWEAYAARWRAAVSA